MSTQKALERRRTSVDEERAKVLEGLPVTERRLQVAGISTSLLESGEGPPMVLLHGPGEFSGVWIRVLPELVRTYGVIVPDLPGHGDSEWFGDRAGAEDVLAWLDGLIQRTCPVPPILVGHLLGGSIAARYAIQRPDRVHRLVLVDSMGLGPYRPSLRFALVMVGFMARPTERTQERLFRGCFADFDGVRTEIGDRWEPLASYALTRARTPRLQTSLRKMMPAFGLNTIPAAELERLDLPTALIWGRHDRQVRLSVAESASARFGWPLHVIEDAGDDPAFEQPEAFLNALRIALEPLARKETVT